VVLFRKIERGWLAYQGQRHITFIATEEIKLDGYRAVAVKSDRVVNLFGTNPSTINIHTLLRPLANSQRGTVVDGEVVALDDSGRPNFNMLAQFRSGASSIHYFIFDLLVCNDRDLTGLPLGERL
jgi:bifunctional non-homologous end joining protein LigD